MSASGTKLPIRDIRFDGMDSEVVEKALTHRLAA
jgi:hypothetical protein